MLFRLLSGRAMAFVSAIGLLAMSEIFYSPPKYLDMWVDIYKTVLFPITDAALGWFIALFDQHVQDYLRTYLSMGLILCGMQVRAAAPTFVFSRKEVNYMIFGFALLVTLWPMIIIMYAVFFLAGERIIGAEEVKTDMHLFWESAIYAAIVLGVTYALTFQG